MKATIQSLFKNNLISFADKLFSPPERLTVINNIFVFIVIGFIAGTLLKGCGTSIELKNKAGISNNKQ